MRIRRVTYDLGNVIERQEYLDGRYGAPGEKRAKKKNAIFEHGVAGMKVDSVPARNQVKRLVNIRHKLLGIPGLSRIVSRCLYAA